MQPHNEFRFHPQVVQIGCYWGEGGLGHTDLYLLEGDSLAIIDTGVADSPTKYIAPALKPYGLTLADIDVILNTHGHHDHTGGNGSLVDASGAKVYVHEADADIAQDPDCQFDSCCVDRHVLVGHPERLDAARAAFKVNAGRPTKVDVKLTDGELLDLGKGIQLRVLHSPGHTRGSVCYYWEKEGLVFAGDSIPGVSGNIEIGPGGLPLIWFPAQMERTIERLLEMDFYALALGHHYRTLALPRDSIHFGANAKAYLQDCRKMTGMIAAALCQVVSMQPEAGFLEAARAATDLLCEQLPIAKNADGLAKTGSTEALHGYWQLMKEA
jgi:glyoxylase-like metal-dependent hydrolase (beta-lactamase superfamily II)